MSEEISDEAQVARLVRKENYARAAASLGISNVSPLHEALRLHEKDAENIRLKAEIEHLREKARAVIDAYEKYGYYDPIGMGIIPQAIDALRPEVKG